MDIFEESVILHKKLKGKIEIRSKFQVKNKEDLSLVYTPGVAAVCERVRIDPLI